ncbi:hypothetical protein EYC80_008551 [Monilinia laxa]|uniref:NAD(P)-binding domain-containing protein n=1 Tax=Monilinia laxa TaxID=61186 RepID=A0A5N6K0P0_MONLA|nr:hypothetical protein EYC80_008551 [Monilinia laxa]
MDLQISVIHQIVELHFSDWIPQSSGVIELWVQEREYEEGDYYLTSRRHRKTSRSGSSPTLLPNTKGVKFDWLDFDTYDNPFISPNGKGGGEGHSIKAAFIISPPVLDALPLAQRFIDRVIEKGVRRIIFLGGSIQHCGDGPVLSQISEYIKGKGSDFNRLDEPNDSNLNAVKWTILRPSWFMENFSEMHHLYTIRDDNQIVSATGTGKIPFVSAEDIAIVAYKALIGKKTNGIERELVGMELLLRGDQLWSYDDIASTLTRILGRKITHVNMEEKDIVRGMVDEGVEEDLANVLVELDIAVKKGEEAQLGGDLELIIGRRGKGLIEYLEECARSGIWDTKGDVERGNTKFSE